MKARWVIAAYDPKSEEGKRVFTQALNGVGYYYLNPERQASEDVIVGFIRAEDSAIPDHLEYAADHQALKLDEMRARRYGIQTPKTI